MCIRTINRILHCCRGCIQLISFDDINISVCAALSQANTFSWPELGQTQEVELVRHKFANKWLTRFCSWLIVTKDTLCKASIMCLISWTKPEWRTIKFTWADHLHSLETVHFYHARKIGPVKSQSKTLSTCLEFSFKWAQAWQVTTGWNNNNPPSFLRIPPLRPVLDFEQNERLMVNFTCPLRGFLHGLCDLTNLTFLIVVLSIVPS
jgi:hypothetical protein